MLERLPLAPITIKRRGRPAMVTTADPARESRGSLSTLFWGPAFVPRCAALRSPAASCSSAYSQTPVVAVDLLRAGRRIRETSSHRTRTAQMLSLPLPRPSWPMFRGAHPRRAHASGNLQQGPIAVAPIGSPGGGNRIATGLTWAGGSKAMPIILAPLIPTKAAFGHVLVIGGSAAASLGPPR